MTAPIATRLAAPLGRDVAAGPRRLADVDDVGGGRRA